MKDNIESVYIHIPFCEKICSYCDFCKIYYSEYNADKYLEALNEEIKSHYKGDLIKTLYIGGGTPSSLSQDQFHRLFDIIKIFKLDRDYEFTFECNIENINEEKMKIMYDNGVNRVSIGIQTFNEHLLSQIGRNHKINEVKSKIALLKQIGFKNINVDLMYALPGETLEILKKDINEFMSLDVEHISTYSLILEPNTIFGINGVSSIDEELELKMYQYICDYLAKYGYNHYELSNFARLGSESTHNLNYWNNASYYGFGLGATGYINDIRYQNTKSIKNYISGNYRYQEKRVSTREKMENEMVLGLRKIKGVDREGFKEKYKLNIEDVFDIDILLKKGLLIDDGNNIYINEKFLYVSNSILVNFIGGKDGEV